MSIVGWIVLGVIAGFIASKKFTLAPLASLTPFAKLAMLTAKTAAALKCYSAAIFFEPPCRSAKRLPSFASCFNSGAGSHQ